MLAVLESPGFQGWSTAFNEVPSLRSVVLSPGCALGPPQGALKENTSICTSPPEILVLLIWGGAGYPRWCFCIESCCFKRPDQMFLNPAATHRVPSARGPADTCLKVK